jgi:hypothetical protein
MMLFANPISAPRCRASSPGRRVDRQWFPPGARRTCCATCRTSAGGSSFSWLVLGAWTVGGLFLSVLGHFRTAGARVGRPRRPRGRRRTGRRRRLTFRPLGIASRRRDAKPCTARGTTAEAVSRAAWFVAGQSRGADRARRRSAAVRPVVVEERLRRGILRLVGGLVALDGGAICSASCLPSSTPHWSNELMPQITPCVKVMCS